MLAINPQNHLVRIEQLRLIYRQGPVLVLGATLAAVVIAAFLWPYIADYGLVVWLSLVFASAGLRIVVFVSFQRYGFPDSSANRRTTGSMRLTDPVSGARCVDVVPSETRFWGGLFSAGSLLAGCVWGLLPILTAHELTPVYLLLLSTLFAGMVAVTALAGSIYLPAFYTFALPMALPICVIEFRSGVDYLLLTAVLLLLYLLVSALLAHRGYGQFVELIDARERIERLMVRVTDEKRIAETAVIAKNRFMAAASHDLRQPLHALGMFIGSLRHRDRNDERLSIINDMAASTDALSQLLHSLLDLSRLDAGLLKATIRPVAFKPVLTALAHEFAPQASQKGLSFELKVEDVTVASDPVLLDRILRNLLVNALRYTERGGIRLIARTEPRIDCQTQDKASENSIVSKRHGEQRGDRVVLRVEDTGAGIASKDQQRVFEEYRQLHPEVSESEQGLGLGLSIVRRFCVLLNMPLQLESTPGVGSVFQMVLQPVKRQQLQTDEIPIQGDWKNTLVLLIDDEQQVRDAMGRRLQDWGCEVMAAASAQDAVRQCALARRSPDILLCDYRLRNGESGIDAAVALSEDSGQVLPTLLITGDTSSDCLREAAVHALPVVHKPVDEKQLCEAMRQCLNAVTAPGENAAGDSSRGQRVVL